MERLIFIAKALSDSGRVRILLALRDRELCVCRIIELLQLAPSTVSKHLDILRQAGLVTGRKEGRWVHYRLSDKQDGTGSQALDWIFRTTEQDPAAQADRRRLEAIMATDLHDLVQIYK